LNDVSVPHFSSPEKAPAALSQSVLFYSLCEGAQEEFSMKLYLRIVLVFVSSSSAINWIQKEHLAGCGISRPLPVWLSANILGGLCQHKGL